MSGRSRCTLGTLFACILLVGCTSRFLVVNDSGEAVTVTFMGDARAVDGIGDATWYTEYYRSAIFEGAPAGLFDPAPTIRVAGMHLKNGGYSASVVSNKWFITNDMSYMVFQSSPYVLAIITNIKVGPEPIGLSPTYFYESNCLGIGQVVSNQRAVVFSSGINPTVSYGQRYLVRIMLDTGAVLSNISTFPVGPNVFTWSTGSLTKQ